MQILKGDIESEKTEDCVITGMFSKKEPSTKQKTTCPLSPTFYTIFRKGVMQYYEAALCELSERRHRDTQAYLLTFLYFDYGNKHLRMR